MVTADTHRPWPELPWREWERTISTLHMWSQIVGKVRLALSPPLNHWWHVPLYVTPRGLTTSVIPYARRSFAVDFDLVGHRLHVDDSEGGSFTVALEPKPVARFYREFTSGLHDLGIEAHTLGRPVEVTEAIPFASDEQHASYDRTHAGAFLEGLLHADRVMKSFQSGFVGKASPVQFFWGSFDLAAARYSGRPAPRHPGGAAHCAAWVMEEAYSREESAVGWWPSCSQPGPAFYAYTYPEPAGLRGAAIRPDPAFFDARLGEFILPYDAVREVADPDAAVLEFFESTYGAGADLGGWDRSALEPAVRPDRPPTRAWSTMDPRISGQLRPASPGDAHRHGARDGRGLR